MKLRKSRTKSQNKKKMEGLKLQFWTTGLLPHGSDINPTLPSFLQQSQFEKSVFILAFFNQHENHTNFFSYHFSLSSFDRNHERRKNGRQQCIKIFSNVRKRIDQLNRFLHTKKKMQTKHLSIRIFSWAFRRTPNEHKKFHRFFVQFEVNQPKNW